MDVIDVLTDLFILCGPPAFIYPDNGPVFVAEAARRWIEMVGAKTAYIESGSPQENGYSESFRIGLLNGEIFYGLMGTQTVIEEWCKHFKLVRPHSALGYRSPTPESVVPMDHKTVMH